MTTDRVRSNGEHDCEWFVEGMPEAQVSSLCVSVKHLDDALVLSLVGEIDLSTASTLRAQLCDAVAERPPDLLLDFRLVTFVDLVGLSILVMADTRCRNDGVSLVLLSPLPEVRHLLDTTRLTEVLTIYPPGQSDYPPGQSDDGGWATTRQSAPPLVESR